MKKVSSVIEEKNIYYLEKTINDTALVKSVTGKMGLINTKTNEIVGSFGFFSTDCYDDDNFYLQKKEIAYKVDDRTKRDYYIRIYDALHEKIVVDDWLIVKRMANHSGLVILQNPDTKKYRLFQTDKFRTSLNVFDNEYDDIQYLCEYNGKFYFVLTKNGKKAVYSSSNGIITPFEYDDIEKIGEVIIFKQGEYKFFTCLKTYKTNIIKSPLFDEINGDKKNKNFLYCKKDNKISIYYIENFHTRLLFTTTACDDIKYMQSIYNYDYEGIRLNVSKYIFLAKKCNKYGLLSGSVSKDEENAVPCQLLVNIEYDEIDYNGYRYFLNKDGKQGLFNGYLINVEYDKVVPINYDFYELYNGDSCDIVLINNNNNNNMQTTIINNCKIIENNNDAVVFEKNGKKGIFWVFYNGKYHIFDSFDDVEYLGFGYFLVTKNEKKGIIHNAQVIIEPKYKSIEMNGIYKYSPDILGCTFLLKKSDGKHELVKYKTRNYNWNVREFEYSDVESFNDIELFDYIVVFKNQNNTYIYNYDGKLLKTIPANVQVSRTVVNKGGYKIGLYLIDGRYYFLNNQKFEEVPIEDYYLYATAYESEYGTVVVNSYDKQEHDEICQQIENDGEEILDKKLISYYESNPKIQEKYPALVKKIVSK